MPRYANATSVGFKFYPPLPTFSFIREVGGTSRSINIVIECKQWTGHRLLIKLTHGTPLYLRRCSFLAHRHRSSWQRFLLNRPQKEEQNRRHFLVDRFSFGGRSVGARTSRTDRAQCVHFGCNSCPTVNMWQQQQRQTKISPAPIKYRGTRQFLLLFFCFQPHSVVTMATI